jgi:hypothetical protein
MGNEMLMRTVASVILIVLYGWLNFILNPAATLEAGKYARGQFENNDAAAITSVYGINFFGNIGIPLAVLLFILVIIWWKPAKAGIAALIATLCMLFLPLQPAQAYYDQTNYTEVYFILPNESAFFIPDTGANKDSQGQFGSEVYLRENKIASKRFVIPHAKLEGTSYWSNFYVPTGRLIIVDRTPYQREWVASHARGTSVKNESFPCQSVEGINITVEISIAASVHEENSPRYLYWFGVKPPVGDRSKPEVIFTSVFYSRTLTEVMDGVGRGKVQALVCQEIGARTADKANLEANAMMKNVENAAKTFFESRGITLDYIGWAGTFTFDPEVQKAINDRYAAEKIAPVLPIIQAQADVKIKEGLGAGLASKGLPASFLAIPQDMMDLSKLFTRPAPESAPAPK